MPWPDTREPIHGAYRGIHAAQSPARASPPSPPQFSAATGHKIKSIGPAHSGYRSATHGVALLRNKSLDPTPSAVDFLSAVVFRLGSGVEGVAGL